LEEAATEAKKAHLGELLYLAYNSAGHAYVGITGGIESRFANHLPLQKVMEKGGEIWVGIMVAQKIPGRKPEGSSTKFSLHVKLAEQILIYSIQPSENKHHRDVPPSAPGILMNRWFDPRDPWARRGRGHKEWPDVIEYEEELDLIQKAWFDGRLEVLDRERIHALNMKNSN
jgi:hypothetical protein